MTDLARSGAILGFLVGSGLLLVWFGLPRHRRAGLGDRVLPYLKDAPRPSNLLASDAPSHGVLGTLLAPVVGQLSGHVERIMGGAPSVRRRLLRAGQAPDVDRFRAQQVVWGATAGLSMLVLGSLSVLTRGTSPVLVLLLTGIGVASGVAAADWFLSHRANKREERMLAEFPTVAELLALAVGAGEGAVGALERVCRLSHGALSDELRQCLADARAGASLQAALQGLADRTGLMSLTRFVDGIVIAVERGTPLADVLRAQAQDVREEGRRAVMEAGGKKEIAMMVPVVFLVLPVTVLFAVFPGFSFLKFTM
ncbi:type II secretion system F family protein [Knoellia subterranea]|uniref:Pilus assembly protein TadB n=1 Tax=Knoellia subterranea KCTC 19937 TaxID=1385521 RepID=A0A0A0JRB2_9MICO|nr:type II secretion system F family protein [Knoellia subterranea]KGN39269.1 pilus assembly protein TadB [Knoellia subterranea KCTC 19937]